MIIIVCDVSDVDDVNDARVRGEHDDGAFSMRDRKNFGLRHKGLAASDRRFSGKLA